MRWVDNCVLWIQSVFLSDQFAPTGIFFSNCAFCWEIANLSVYWFRIRSCPDPKWFYLFRQKFVSDRFWVHNTDNQSNMLSNYITEEIFRNWISRCYTVRIRILQKLQLIRIHKPTLQCYGKPSCFFTAESVGWLFSYFLWTKSSKRTFDIFSRIFLSSCPCLLFPTPTTTCCVNTSQKPSVSTAINTDSILLYVCCYPNLLKLLPGRLE